MSVFRKIAPILKSTADKLGDDLTKDRPGYHESLRTFEERRIDWEEDGIRKAIIIQPKFTSKGVDSSFWSLVNVAWIPVERKGGKRAWSRSLIDHQPFDRIESEIKDLLKVSLANLATVTESDLTWPANRQ